MDKSIANRIAISMLLLALGIASLVGWASYLFTSQQISHSIQDQLNSQANLAKQRVEFGLQVLVQSAEGLAANSLVANGLVDSAGRIAYLVPFLRDFKAPIQVSGVKIDLADFQGKTIVSNHSDVNSANFGSTAWYDAALNQSRAYASIEMQGNANILIMAFPVIYPATGHAEGMLVMRIPLQQLLSEYANLIINEVDELALLDDEKHTLVAFGKSSNIEVLKVSQAIALSPPLDQLHLEISIATSRAIAFKPLRSLALVYLIVGLITMSVALISAKIIARRLVLGVTQLSEVANHISQSGSLEIRIPEGGNDEVGSLGNALRSMLAALRASHDNLESLVKARTNALAESESRLQTIMDSVQEAIITFSSDGLILSFNKGAEKIFGYEHKALTGHSFAMLFADEMDMSIFAFCPHPDQNGKALTASSMEQNARRADGTIFRAELVIGQMMQEPHCSFVVAIRDMTERHKVDRMKSEFISVVSHELRTPLTAIRGSLGLLYGNVAGEMPTAQKSLVDISLRNTERLITLVNDILDMEKIATGNMHFDFQWHDLHTLLNHAIEGVRPFGSQYDVVFKLEAPPKGTSINVDSARFAQIIANLLSNSAKFSPAKSQVEIGVTENNDHIHIFVADHGKGIPDTFHDKIFQKFSQVEDANTRSKGGSGLGLSITKELVERMGGTICFESKEGVGTTFHINFPYIRNNVEALSNKASGPSVSMNV